MKKNFFILIASALFFVSCRQEADSRYFAPTVEFASGQYELNLERQTSLEVEAVLSRPAAVAMEVRLVFGGTLREGSTIRHPHGVSVSLERPYKTSVQVTKVFHTPILKLLSAQKAVTANPFLAEEIPMTLESHIPVQNDLTVHLASTGLVLGQDLYVKGAEAATLVLPAGRQKLDFTLQIAFKDESGYAGRGTLSLAPGEGYEVSGSSGALSVTLGDPVVDFKSLHKPRTFLARIGTYAQWQADVTGGKAWVVDSRATGGDISASTHPALTGTIALTLEKVEGIYDFTGSSASILLSAWWSSPSEQFMQGFDTEKFDVSQENGLWKVQYKLWPR